MAKCACGQTPKYESDVLCDACALVAWREHFAEGYRDIHPTAVRKDAKLGVKEGTKI